MTDIQKGLEAVAAEMLGKSETPEASEEQLDEISWDQPKKGAAPAEKMQSVPGTRQDMGPAVVSPDAPSDMGKEASKKASQSDKLPRKGKPSAASGKVESDKALTPGGPPAKEEVEADENDEIIAETETPETEVETAEVVAEAETTEEEVVEAETDEEVKEETIEDRLSAMDFTDDVKALTEGEDDFSDEFKQKAATIFEAAVKAKIRTELEAMTEAFQTKYDGAIEEAKDDMTDKVDGYLNYVVEEWMKQNEMAVQHKMKTEIAESFIKGLKTLFEDHNIAVPEDQFDMLDAAASKADELEGKLNETMERNIELTKEVGELKRNEILLDVASDLADTEVEKFAELTENVEYSGEEDFREKIATLMNSYFPKATANSDDTAAPEDTEDFDVSDTMAAYMSAITRAEARGVASKV
jgi:hypothetical protein